MRLAPCSRHGRDLGRGGHSVLAADHKVVFPTLDLVDEGAPLVLEGVGVGVGARDEVLLVGLERAQVGLGLCLVEPHGVYLVPALPDRPLGQLDLDSGLGASLRQRSRSHGHGQLGQHAVGRLLVHGRVLVNALHLVFELLLTLDLIEEALLLTLLPLVFVGLARADFVREEGRAVVVGGVHRALREVVEFVAQLDDLLVLLGVLDDAVRVHLLALDDLHGVPVEELLLVLDLVAVAVDVVVNLDRLRMLLRRQAHRRAHRLARLALAPLEDGALGLGLLRVVLPQGRLDLRAEHLRRLRVLLVLRVYEFQLPT